MMRGSLRGTLKLKTLVFDSSASSCPVSHGSLSRRVFVVSFTQSDVGLVGTYTRRSCVAIDPGVLSRVCLLLILLLYT